MSELTEKKNRALEVIDQLTAEMGQHLPMMLSNTLKVFLTSYRGQFSNVPDEELDKLIAAIRVKLDYIESGE